MNLMKYTALPFMAVCSFAASLMVMVAPAQAQATRTWVSGVGDDVNPCSRTAPCKTFAGAISKTAAGGEINCLDPGGFGGVTITKSLSIVCDYTEGGVLTAGAGVNGIVVNVPAATDTVFLSGLDFNGAGTAQNGIRIVSGGIVHVQNSLIRNFRASNGLGMSVVPAGPLKLTVENTTVADNGTGATGGGILVQPNGVGGNANVTLRNVRLQNNSNNNLFSNTTGNTGGGISTTIVDSQFTGSGNGIHALTPAGASGQTMTIIGTFITHNTTTGIRADGAAGVLLVSSSTIMGNALGVNRVNAGNIFTYGDNVNDGNTGGDGTFNAPPLVKE